MSESLANQSRFRHERDQDMHHLREVIQSHLNQEIEGVHSRVKEWTTKEAEAQARTRDVLLQHIDKSFSYTTGREIRKLVWRHGTSTL